MDRSADIRDPGWLAGLVAPIGRGDSRHRVLTDYVKSRRDCAPCSVSRLNCRCGRGEPGAARSDRGDFYAKSFIMPTHHVNALVMGPAGFKVTDFLKRGGIMTVLFLVVSMNMHNFVF